MRAAPFWRRGEAGVLSRLLTDLVLFDLLESHQEMLAARTLSVRGEKVHVEAPLARTTAMIPTLGPQIQR